MRGGRSGAATGPGAGPPWLGDLLAWYRSRPTVLPWRMGPPDPYRVLVAESMLQQTQVATALPYYERFLARFPRAADLAQAPEEEVLHLWEGLGYYRRARHLQAAARIVAEEWAYRPPRDLADLRRLPGVGPYVAGALGAIAFGWPVGAVDGNVRRVASRLEDLALPVDRPPGRARVERWARDLAVASGAPGDLVQALMDLGREVCRPRSPDCPRCPVATACRAREAGTVRQRPVTAAGRPAVREERLTIFAVSDGQGRVLAGRRGEGLLGRLWGLPVLPEGDPDWRRHLAEQWGVRPLGEGHPVGRLVHRYSHRLWRAAVVAVQGEGTPLPGAAFLAPHEQAGRAFGAAFRRALTLWREHLQGV